MEKQIVRCGGMTMESVVAITLERKRGAHALEAFVSKLTASLPPAPSIIEMVPAVVPMMIDYVQD